MVHVRLRVPLVLLVILGLTAPAPMAAADPIPAQGPAAPATTPTTPSAPQVEALTSTEFGIGDVFVAVSNGQVQWRLPDGTLNATLDTGLGGYTTGMAFDKDPGNLYVTNFTAGAVTRFDPSGNRLGTFGTGYNSSPESIVFDAAGDVLVGQAGGSRDVLRFDGGGQFRASYNVPTGPIGSDWIDLSIDQCTLLYTSEGTSIRRFNVCTNTTMSDLTGGFTQAFALRILPGALGILVADTTTIKLVDNFVGGGITRVYDAPGQDCWFALNLDRTHAGSPRTSPSVARRNRLASCGPPWRGSRRRS
jgi:DNA-binding beta-propeller fold protein YncE